MLPPEIQRIVLLIGLAATGYLMILAWNDDMQEAKQPVQYDDAPLLEGQLPLSDTPAVADRPGATASSDNDSDVPSAALANVAVESTPDLVESGASFAGGDQLVKVSTSSLRVWIDRKGGDVVRVQLPGFPVDLDHPEIPFQILDRSARRTYVAQSGLIGPDGPDSKGRPLYSSSLDSVEVADGEEREIVLSASLEGAQLRKIFTFRGDDFLFDVRYEMTNNSGSPKRASMYAQIKRDDKAPEHSDSFALAPQPFLGAAYTFPEERYFKADFEDVEEEPINEKVDGGWVAFLQHYFLSAWVPPQDQTNTFYGERMRSGDYRFGYVGQSVEVAPGQTGTWSSQFYVGPKDQKRLEQIAENLNLTVDYGFLWWIAVPLFYLLDWLYAFSGNWGLAIILLTVVVKALLYPLSAAGYKSMANMRRVAPAMKRLQERYANDREKLSREMMALYKKEGANPLGGCLPMLLPMPIFLALYWVLFESVELRQAPFFLWIVDLSVMDPFFILPLLMGASMYWMQTLNPQVGDPMQIKMMKMMPIMFTVLFLFFPAGLVLYWLVNNVLSIAQQQYVYRQAEKAHAGG